MERDRVNGSPQIVADGGEKTRLLRARLDRLSEEARALLRLRPEVLLGLSPLEELADPVSDVGEEVKEVFVQSTPLATEELEDADGLSALDDRKSTRGPQLVESGERSARKVCVVARVHDPGGPASRPDTTRHADARRKRHPERFGRERRSGASGVAPDLETPQDEGARVDRPEEADRPAEALADGSQEGQSRLLERVRFRQDGGDREVHRLSLRGPLHLRDVAREGSGVKEPLPLELRVRIDQDVLDRAVFRDEARLEVLERLAARQSREHPKGDVGVRVHLGDPPAHVLLARVAQELELGAVRPQDHAVGVDPVEPHRGLLEEVGQVALAPAQLGLGVLPLLEGERAGEGQGALARERPCEVAVFGREHPGGNEEAHGADRFVLDREWQPQEGARAARGVREDGSSRADCLRERALLGEENLGSRLGHLFSARGPVHEDEALSGLVERVEDAALRAERLQDLAKDHRRHVRRRQGLRELGARGLQARQAAGAALALGAGDALPRQQLPRPLLGPAHHVSEEARGDTDECEECELEDVGRVRDCEEREGRYQEVGAGQNGQKRRDEARAEASVPGPEEDPARHQCERGRAARPGWSAARRWR